jgi:RNA polymerase-binding transcription factor DksA
MKKASKSAKTHPATSTRSARTTRDWNDRSKARMGALLDQEIARITASELAIEERAIIGAQSAGDSEVDAKLADLESQELSELRAAKLRFANSNFGRCELCKRWIEKKRLMALPTARTCITCVIHQATERPALDGC